MSFSKECQDYHLTPRGWVKGSFEGDALGGKKEVDIRQVRREEDVVRGDGIVEDDTIEDMNDSINQRTQSWLEFNESVSVILLVVGDPGAVALPTPRGVIQEHKRTAPVDHALNGHPQENVIIVVRLVPSAGLRELCLEDLFGTETQR